MSDKVKGMVNRMFKEDEMSAKNGLSATMTIKDWIKYSLLGLLSAIPFVGTIAYLVIYLMLICSQDTNKSLRNYMLANLIISCVALILCVILIVLLLPINPGQLTFPGVESPNILVA